MHGHDDPMGPPARVLDFEAEMSAAQADWQVHVYGGAKHAFTNPQANDQGLGTVYNALANQRAQRALADFLAELFAWRGRGRHSYSVSDWLNTAGSDFQLGIACKEGSHCRSLFLKAELAVEARKRLVMETQKTVLSCLSWRP